MSPKSLFWRTIPRSSLVGFLLGVFFLFNTTGFATDVMETGRQPAVRLILAVSLSGIFAVIYAVLGVSLGRQFWKAFLPVFILQLALMSYLAQLFPDLREPGSRAGRLVVDGIAMMASTGLGYACFIYVSIAEARRYARVYTEMNLAAEIHRVLVPPIDTKIGDFEFFGRSFPSGEVGGDLIDVFQHGGRWIAYIADVSGHGVAPGVVMAMVKSAARMQLSSAEEGRSLLERLNSVLHPIKKPEMFVTFAYIAWDGERLEYSSAGHPAILQYHAATKQVSEIACENFPLGLFGEQSFTTGRVDWAPGDLFLLITDGLLEVTNRKDEEFGMATIKQLISKHGNDSLNTGLQTILDANNQHGHAADDRSLLLIRQCGTV